MPSVKVLKSNRITIPKEIRQALNLKEGDLLTVEIKDNFATMRKYVAEKQPRKRRDKAEQ